MNRTASNETCIIGKKDGYLLPMDYYPLPAPTATDAD
jgi:hypothetical protein